ncbi:hypothetical protein GEMRC1_008933 [Eukaryota sp. GEM-RC1]
MELTGLLLPEEEIEIHIANFLIADVTTVTINNQSVSFEKSSNSVHFVLPDLSCESSNNLSITSSSDDSLLQSFSSSSPVIKSLSEEPPITGGNVRLRGKFGSESWNRSILIGDEPVDFDFVSPSIIDLYLPPGQGLTQLHLSTCSFSSFFNFSYSPPLISSFESGLPSTRGGMYILLGKGFSSELKVSTEAKFISTSKLKILIPEGSGKGHGLQIVSSNVSSNKFIFSYQGPIITSVSETKSKGSKITIKGDNFGPNADHVDEVLIGSKQCRDITMTKSHSLITCLAPSIKFDGKTKEVPIVVSISGQQASDIILYSANTGINWILVVIVGVSILFLGGLFFITPVRQLSVITFRRVQRMCGVSRRYVPRVDPEVCVSPDDDI